MENISEERFPASNGSEPGVLPVVSDARLGPCTLELKGYPP